jgi:hypothetical protein
MKRFLLFISLVPAFPAGLWAGDDAVNVISYYAVGNSLDGQPMIDRVNVLRFYPVFAMRDGTDSVVVTIYYGSSIFVRAAEKMDGGRYWQSLLPKFSLGEAIQRIEVEVLLDLKLLHLENEELRKSEAELTSQIEKFQEMGLKEEVDRLARAQTDPKRYAIQQRSFAEKVQDESLIEAYTRAYSQLYNRYRSQLAEILADTMYSGPSVKKSDITIDLSEIERPKAGILYRNYKSSLRRLPALDPAERMGIFRIRYVPFPIVGTKRQPRMNLVTPLGENSTAVFEIGLAFGDAIVPGDEFVVPEFSFRRLGFAFAITEKLFGNEAEIIGLALTYDFNSYGSIGLGGNFAQDEVHGYASFGINKKAFEAVLAGLAGLFK